MIKMRLSASDTQLAWTKNLDTALLRKESRYGSGWEDPQIADQILDGEAAGRGTDGLLFFRRNPLLRKCFHGEKDRPALTG
jgi:hypothetical protein